MLCVLYLKYASDFLGIINLQYNYFTKAEMKGRFHKQVEQLIKGINISL